MSDVTMTFIVSGEYVGEMRCGLESFDSSPHRIPEPVVHKLLSSPNKLLEISISIEHGGLSK